MKTTLLILVISVSLGFSHPYSIGGWTVNGAGLNGIADDLGLGDLTSRGTLGQNYNYNTDSSNLGGHHENIVQLAGVHSSGGKTLFNLGDKPITDIGGITVTGARLPLSGNTDTNNVGGSHQNIQRLGGVWLR